MTRVMAAVVAMVFAAGALAPTAWAQSAAPAPVKGAPTTTAPAKTEPPKPEPAKTEPPKPAASAPAEKPAAAEKKAAEDQDRGKLDINTASAADLKAAGFSGAEAKKVIDGRPYRRKDELIRKNIVSKETYSKVKEGLVAHHVKDAKPDAKKK